MKNIKLILAVSLALNSFSVMAEENQSLSQKIQAHVGPVAEKAGRVAKKSVRVAKIGAYGLLTGVSGAATAIPLVFACWDTLDTIDKNGRDFHNGRASSHDVTDIAIITAISTPFYIASSYGMGKLTMYFAQKTKQAVQELKS